MSGRQTGLRFCEMPSYHEIFAEEWEREFGRMESNPRIMKHFNLFPERIIMARERAQSARKMKRGNSGFWEKIEGSQVIEGSL